MHLPAGQRLEQGTSEARETCRGHVLVPACVWRPGWAASEPRRPLQKETPSQQGGVFCIYRPGRGSNRARAKREKHAGGMFWCPRACGGPAGPPASLVARSKKKYHPNRMVFLCICRAAGDVLTVMQAAQKRRIATTLLSCSEDGAREHYSIICCTFSFSLQPLCQWLHRR